MQRLCPRGPLTIRDLLVLAAHLVLHFLAAWLLRVGDLLLLVQFVAEKVVLAGVRLDLVVLRVGVLPFSLVHWLQFNRHNFKLI